MIYINAQDSSPSWNKSDYLLNADRQYSLDMFKRWIPSVGKVEYLLNVEPCNMMTGTKWTGLWHIDAYLNNEYQHAMYGLVDDVFIATTPECCQRPYPQGHVLFQAADIEIDRRFPEIKQEYDFVMCGSMGNPVYTNREQAYSKMKEKFSYYDFGKGFPPADYIKKLNSARVQFIHTGEGPNRKCNAAQRFFECLPIGPVLTNWTPDLPATGLIEGEDYLAYHNEDEMIEKMTKLIKDPEYREKIAVNGRKKALLYHTYVHRALAIHNVAYADISVA